MGWCCPFDLGLLPMAVGITMAMGMVVTYIVAIWQDHVEPIFPYISDDGASSPESCVFSQLLNIAAFLAMACMYIRYKTIAALTEERSSRINRLNRSCLLLATFSCIGLSLVGNFQETNVEVVHLAGAFMVFFFGVLYELLDTPISYILHPQHNGMFICRTRLFISLFSVATFTTTFITGVVSRETWEANHSSDVPGKSRMHWKPDEPGYAVHLVSSIGEWLMALSFLLYFFTYIREFQKLSLNVHVQPLVMHMDDIPPEPEERHLADEYSPLLA